MYVLYTSSDRLAGIRRLTKNLHVYTQTCMHSHIHKQTHTYKAVYSIYIGTLNLLVYLVAPYNIFDEHLHLNTHVKQIICRANNVLGTIKRTFNTRDAAVIQLLYTTLVRPILDYSSTIWNPHQMGNIHELENVQRRATKLILSIQSLPYFERLQNLQFILPRQSHQLDYGLQDLK